MHKSKKKDIIVYADMTIPKEPKEEKENQTKQIQHYTNDTEILNKTEQGSEGEETHIPTYIRTYRYASITETPQHRCMKAHTSQ